MANRRFIPRRVVKDAGKNPIGKVLDGKWAVFAVGDFGTSKRGIPLIRCKSERDAEERALALNWADSMDDFDRGDLYLHRDDIEW